MDIALIFFLLFVIGVTTGSRCPEAEAIAPCRCLPNSNINDILCHGILNADELIPIMQALVNRGTKVYVLSIEKSSLLYLPENLFQNMHIQTIFIRDTELMSFAESDTAFRGLEDTLTSLVATNITSATQWDFYQLNNLRKLSKIMLMNVTVGVIDHQLPDFPDLDVLTIERAEVSDVSDDAFSNLPKLSFFSIANNDITEIKRSMFPNPANYLRTINLSENMLTYLPGDFFDNMPNLVTVFLCNNKFTTLTEEPFSEGFKTIRTLNLSENPLRCDCRMRWLVNARFPSNFMGKCSTPTNLFGEDIRHLDFKSLWC